MSVAEGQALRDDGIARVLSSEDQWKDRYRDIVQVWFSLRPAGHTFTGETLRLFAQSRGLGEPHHHNAWSGQAASAIKQWLKTGAIETTGNLRAAASKRTHAHALREYRKRV